MTKTPIEKLLRRAGLSVDTPPIGIAAWQNFLASTSSLLAEHIERREIYENALAVSVREMERLYDELKAKTQGELDEHRRFLSAVIDALPLGLFCKDCTDDFRYLLWNKRAEEILGFGSTQVLGRTDTEIFGEAIAAQHNGVDVALAKEPGRIDLNESTFRRPDLDHETHIRVYKIAALAVDGRPKYLLGIVQNITAEVDAKGKMIQSAKLASLGEMAGGIAHEINNPVAIIHGSATVLLRVLEKAGIDHPIARRSAQEIVGTCERIEKIIKGLGTFARDGETDPMHVEDLRDIVRATLDLCGERLRHSGIELRLLIPSAPILCVCRQVQISQVLVNLINNAFDAIKPLEDKWIALQLEDLADQTVISVTDSGGGIPEMVRRKIMQPFFTTKALGKGTGLGLSISKTIIEQHNGSFEYDSACAHTRFVVRLPKVGSDAESAEGTRVS